MALPSYNPTRRGFLAVGALTGMGLTLGDYFQLRSARAEQKNYDFIEAKAKSVIHIFLPGGMAHQETFDPKPYAPIEYRGEMGSIPTKIPGEVFSRDAAADGPDRRQDHGHPLDDARRGGPRARHAQHVHRLSPQPGLDLPQHGQRGQPRIRPAEQPAAVRLHSRTSRTNSPAPAT